MTGAPITPHLDQVVIKADGRDDGNGRCPTCGSSQIYVNEKSWEASCVDSIWTSCPDFFYFDNAKEDSKT